MTKLNPDMFHHPLTEVTYIAEVGEEFVNTWGCASFSCWEACNGNKKAEEFVTTHALIGNPLCNVSWILTKAKRGHEPSIRTLMNHVAEGLSSKIQAAHSK